MRSWKSSRRRSLASLASIWLNTGWNFMADGKGNRETLSRRVDASREDCGPDTPLDQCRCRAAVTRAYAGMQLSGAPDSVALEAAMRVYRYHHPEASPELMRETVETWVFCGTVH